MEEKRPKKRIKLGIESQAVPVDEPTLSDSLIAKKDFKIHHNEYRRTIKAGDDLSDVPAEYLPNLRTEGVL